MDKSCNICDYENVCLDEPADANECNSFRNIDFTKMENAIKIIEESEWLKEHDAKIRAEAIDELKPFFDAVSEYVLDWICDDLCGEFVNPKTDEPWCAEHCNNGTGYECVRKWCELKEQKK